MLLRTSSVERHVEGDSLTPKRERKMHLTNYLIGRPGGWLRPSAVPVGSRVTLSESILWLARVPPRQVFLALHRMFTI